MNPWHILFDLDGTLTDPKPGITRCMQYALVKLGEAVPDTDDLLWCIGPPLQDNFARLLSNPTEARIEQAVTYYRERFATVGKFENEVYAGIPEALNALQQEGYHLHVATSKPRVYAVDIIHHFNLSPYFEEIFGSELNGRLREKADLIAYILQTKQIGRSQCMMVGDRKHDIIGAQANTIPAIGVTYGYGSRKELTEAGTSYLVDTPEGLQKMVTRIVMTN
jgi:phosphoglycolate phosphatase